MSSLLADGRHEFHLHSAENPGPFVVPEGAIPVSHHPWGYFNPFNDHNPLVNIVSCASEQVTLCKAFGEIIMYLEGTFYMRLLLLENRRNVASFLEGAGTLEVQEDPSHSYSLVIKPCFG
jgi:hypothetical protein